MPMGASIGYDFKLSDKNRLNITGDRPLKIGIDYMHNSKSYALTDPGITPSNQNEKDDWDAYIVYGSTKKKHDWLLGYWYANIEQLAINSSFTQDDWVRWGSAAQTRATDLNFRSDPG